MANITWIDHKDPEKRQVAIHCGRHLLVSKPLTGNYPNYKQVIPAYAATPPAASASSCRSA